MAYPISKLWFYPLMRLFVGKIKGVENIPSRENFIIASNHHHIIDPLLVCYIILKRRNKKVHFLSNARWWFLGSLICERWAGCIPLFDKEKALEQMKNYLKKKRILAIFPEGNYKTRKMRSVKTGAIRLSLETGVPILPIAIKHSKNHFWHKIAIGKPIFFEKNSKSLDKKAKKLMEIIYSMKESL